MQNPDTGAPRTPWAYGPLGRFLIGCLLVWHISAVVTWLLPEKSREPWLAAEEETARHGLGASTPAQERSVLRATIAQVRERLATWKLELPGVEHPGLGRI